MPLGTKPSKKRTSDKFEDMGALLSDDEDYMRDRSPRPLDNLAALDHRQPRSASDSSSPNTTSEKSLTAPQVSIKDSVRHSSSPAGTSSAGTPSVSPVPADLDEDNVFIVVSSEDENDPSGSRRIRECSLEREVSFEEDKTDLMEEPGETVSEGTRKPLFQYETLAEYVEEITGVKDIPHESIASKLTSQVTQVIEKMERRQSISESNLGRSSSQASLNMSKIVVPGSEDENGNRPTATNKQWPFENVPTIQVTSGSPATEASVTTQLSKLKISAPCPIPRIESDNTSPGTPNSDWELYPSTASMRSVPVSLNNTKEIDEVDEEEKGLVLICAGFLEMLCQVVVSIPNNDLLQVLGIILKPEVLIVLAHHNAPEIRTNAVKVRSKV